jgi:hypothetical protein
VSEFEYLSVLVSIVLGLGITHILSGLSRSLHRRASIPFDPVHSVWAAGAFLVLVINWWVFFQAQEFQEWSFGLYLTVIIWTVLFYLLAVLLFPPDMEEGESYRDVWEGNRRWFMATFAASSASDIALTAWRGDLLDPPWYLPFAGHFVLIGVVGVFVKSRRYHLYVGIYMLTVSLAWALGVRRLLGV